MDRKTVGSVPLLTLDGLSGTGKTSIASQISLDLQWNVLYSGLFYRYLAYCKHQGRFACGDDLVISSSLGLELIHLVCRVNQAGEMTVLAGNQNLSRILSSEDIGREASVLASYPSIRQQLLLVQRSAHRAPGLVAEGRDMGRVVFPQAQLKVYLVADEEVRVQRRYNQLNRGGNDVKIADVATLQTMRDARDAKQAYQALSGPDVLIIDTSNLSIGAVKQTIYRGLLERKAITQSPTIDAIA